MVDSILAFLKELFAFDAYWKVVFLIFFFGTICAYVFTRSLKESTSKWYLQRGVPVSPWRGLGLTCFSSVVGGIVGVMLDISVLPIYDKAVVGEAPIVLVPHYTLLSVLCGIGAGVLSSFSFPFIRGTFTGWFKKFRRDPDPVPTPAPSVPATSAPIFLGRPSGEESDLNRETFSWTDNLDRDDIFRQIQERGEEKKFEKAAAEIEAESLRLEQASKLDEEKAKLEKELAKLKAAQAALQGKKDEKNDPDPD
jgi:hypothetical protein